MDTRMFDIYVSKAVQLARQMKHEYITAEHLLYVICEDKKFIRAFEECGGNINTLKESLKQHFRKHVSLILNEEFGPEFSIVCKNALNKATEFAKDAGSNKVDTVHILYGISQIHECYACYYIAIQADFDEVLNKMLVYTREEEGGDIPYDDFYEIPTHHLEFPGFGIVISEMIPNIEQIPPYEHIGNGKRHPKKTGNKPWMKYVVNLNEAVKGIKEPLIGREDIIERTMQILCRKYKSNVIYLGDPGVGKTAIVNGLAKMINNGRVPEQLKSATIYSIDIGALVAGTKFRGDFEERLENVIKGLKEIKNPIVYIDEIHTVVGAGGGSDGSLDASNMLKKVLTEGKIKFIGSTTYEEYRKYIEKDKALSRRFKTIDIKEPSIDETIQILKGIKKHYEEYHGVKYTANAIKSAVELSAKYITERFLPDKAIDLLDEAGAYIALKKKDNKTVTVDENTIEEVLSKTCNIPKQTIGANEAKAVCSLEDEMKKEVYGQEEAINEIVRCIKTARAGLNEDNKPVANMLFVGPTGTGKTEVAKVLADKLGIKLIRFDMSEYQEEHTVAKLIGSPAGYVGYDDGGLLTEVIRKNPHCVLLLDEIEKAHPDIYNTLLQVMDNATLTDNKGRKADFRNVIIIMTSNAGAREMGKKTIGFNSSIINDSAMDAEVKRVFSPEFRNRLTKIIKFNPINDEMALMIAEKQFRKLKEKIEAKGVSLRVTKRCYKAIADKGISIETGAREIQRIIDSEVKPLFVDKILLGELSEGTECKLDYINDKFKISVKKQLEKAHH